MEGVAFQIVWMMEGFQVTTHAESIKLAGGAAKSPLWVQLLANISSLPIRIPEVVDLACVGAAILAGVGTGLYQTVTECCSKFSVSEKIVAPDPIASKQYRQLLDEYKRKAKLLEDM